MLTKLQAIKFMFAGKKVKLAGWQPTQYLAMTQQEKFINQSGYFVNINDFAGEWDEFKDPKEERFMLSNNQIEVIKVFMLIRKISRKDFAVLVDTSLATCMNIMAQNNRITPVMLEKFAEVLGIPSDKLKNPDVELAELIASR